MQNPDHFVPSTNAGQSWNCYAYKPGNKRPPYVNATEGELKQGDGHTCFTTLIDFQQPTHDLRTLIPGGRMTDKAVAAAMAEMKQKMTALGLIEA